MTTYLKQFARNKKQKEKTEVLTARLPHSLYSDFKAYCDELGLSISEAVNLLVEREIASLKRDSETAVAVETNTDNYKSSGDETKANTNVVTNNSKRIKSTIQRFTTNQWKINNQLPCPICQEWKAANNFRRHANKMHKMTTQEIFTSNKYKDTINAMIDAKKAK
ncbi:hypothetical protein [Peribacillus sp. Hz7]|uniref:hypothetical protein n=1 Tax=Peribacillus sp. Hz7 TaxID=3344873 RepID=UPI0035CBA0C6